MADDKQDPSLVGSTSAGVGVAAPPGQGTTSGSPDQDAAKGLDTFFGQGGAPAQAPPTQPTPTQLPGPVIPSVPEPAPGAYNPEQEQKALKSTEWIADPERRMRVQSTLKREYANLAIADGITANARENNLKKAFSDYTTAIKKINDDPDASWDKKLLVARKVVDAMWDDPRTGIGDSRQQIEAHMLSQAGIKNTRGYGPFFNDAYQGVVNKQITSMQQLLQMGAQGKLTPAGVDETAKALSMMDKPDQQINAEQRALAFKNVSETIYKDLNETDPFTQQQKASGKQVNMVNRIQEGLLAQISAAKGDVDKVAKIVSSENVDKYIESVYPRYERHFDNVTRGGAVNLNGVVVPAFIDTNSQTAYRDIALAPPSSMNAKTNKMELLPPEGWQMAVNGLLSKQTPENIAAFKQRYPSAPPPEYIIKSVKTVAPPPGSSPVPVVPAAREAMDLTLGSPSTTLNKAIDTTISAFGKASGMTADQIIAGLRASLPIAGVPSEALNKTIDTIMSSLAGVAGQEAKKPQGEAKK